MKKLLVVLSLILMVGCTTTGQAYLPHTSRVFHAKKNCVGCYDPNPIVFRSVQAAANSSGIAPCSICIKTKQYTPPSSYSYNSLGTSTSPNINNLNTPYGINQSSSLNNASPSIGIISTNSTFNNRGVAENSSYYGEISDATKRPKTVYVNGYNRKDGTYVRSHYRSPPRNETSPIGLTQSTFVPIAPKPSNSTESLSPPKIYKYTPSGFPIKGSGILDKKYSNPPTKGFGILGN